MDLSNMASGDRPFARLRTLAAHVTTQTSPFSAEALEGRLQAEEWAYLELKQNSRVYSLACLYVSAHGEVRSFRYSPEARAEEVMGSECSEA
mmetsp:Transcript_136630/g.304514  ORF Transcript_136630/g.304514 Transcript_136630/m.304514 type:complete len:92 (+) Transcript_136630:90-365(+)